MSELRVYEINTPQYELYKQMHKHQTLDYVIKKKKQYSVLNNQKLSMKDALSQLDNFIDPSDPDLDIPNSIHAYQTAEELENFIQKINNYNLLD